MNAVATCPKCGKKLTTDCRGCIDSKTDVHNCKGKEQVVENIKWKPILREEFEDELDKEVRKK